MDPHTIGWGEFNAMAWARSERLKADDPDAKPDPPSSDRVMRNFAKIPAAALGRAN
ncbi:hypothetical protein [Caulobacter hibisci]|uniref:Uncharacterized protein n=1 Tax=Caulobacter hibisci TaxID=2035993 RepID=A0ABS0SRX7_9CAUL|nr:hypothetical protein [Caulobacter hibisci]MBI1682390.1 hypothetical protein [Caulobacter hibisci]